MGMSHIEKACFARRLDIMHNNIQHNDSIIIKVIYRMLKFGHVCHNLKLVYMILFIILSVIMMLVIFLSVIMMLVISLSVITMFVIIISVISISRYDVCHYP
jgi:hypothetical protein